MTHDELLRLAAPAVDPDDHLRFIEELLGLRWSDGSPVIVLDE